MLRWFMRCCTFKSHKKRKIFLLLLCSIPFALLLLSTRQEVENKIDRNPDVNQRNSPQNIEEISSKQSQEAEQKPRDVPGTSEHTSRQRILLQACRKKKNSDWLNSWPHLKNVPVFPNSPIISTKNKVLFCLVGKVASSFFTRWVLTMNEPGPMKSPFLIPIEKAGRGRAESLKSFKLIKEQIDFLESSTKIVFGRDPYSRIFSAYIDKLYSPNPFYWKYWGEKALRENKVSVQHCGSQVTFPQFVKLVTSTLVEKDVHLKQVADECKMCRMYYDVIGKLETTVADLDYASQLINISSEFQHQDGYKTASQEDVVLDSLKSAFSWKKDIQRCISLDQMGLRIWRKLQIRGVIDSNLKYPFQPGQIDNMDVNTFIDACKRAISASKDKARLKRQKKLAMEEVYLSLDASSIEAILKAYSLDFALFGYSDKPDYLFDNDYRMRLNRTNVLSWDMPWNLH